MESVSPARVHTDVCRGRPGGRGRRTRELDGGSCKPDNVASGEDAKGMLARFVQLSRNDVGVEEGDMKIWTSFIRVAGAVSLVAAVVLCVGCDESGTHGADFRVVPDSATLYTDDTTLTLQAVGGHSPLEWSVSDETVGTVSGSGQTATYTRTTKNGVNVVTVTDGQTWTASATIVQEDTPEETEDLEISPTTATLDYAGDQTVFTGSGGVRPYSWDVGFETRGTVVKQSSTQALYTRVGKDENTVILTDSRGYIAIAEVSQP